MGSRIDRGSSLRRSLRGHWNSFILNPLFTAAYDRIRPLRSLGVRGERVAERHLLRAGYIIVAQSYSDAIGELDLVAIDDKTIVFVEVKSRASDSAGMPAEAVDENKQIRISRTALSYLKHHDLLDCKVRFDVIAITWPLDSHGPSVQHYENAFEAIGVD